MITKFKIFEKLGVNQITFDIADRAWDQIKDQIKYAIENNNNVNVKSEENIHPLKYYKQMVNFTFDFNKLTKYEKSKILGRIDKKNIKKVETYIRQQGQKFIKKIHKLAYFQQEQ